MTFDVCADCGGQDWYVGAIAVALLWDLPGVALAIRRQLARRARACGPLALTQWLPSLGAIPFSLVQFRVTEPSAGFYRLSLQLFAARPVWLRLGPSHSGQFVHEARVLHETAVDMPWVELAIDDDEVAAFAAHYRGRARFLVDESLGVEAARVIHDLGWNAAYVGDLGLAGHDDEAVYGRAWRDDRVILTHDRDFLDDRRFPPHRNPGLVVLPGGSGATPGLERELARVLVTIGRHREGCRGLKIEAHEDRTWTIKSAARGQTERLTRRLRFNPNGTIWEWVGEDA